KHYSVEDWASFIKENSANVLKHAMVSTGTSDADFQKTKDIMALTDELMFICIDIANGYSEHLVEYVEKVRKAFPDKVISAGNVVT
ncbi:IMP dehydrogenase, partial [Photobacterium sp. R1]